MTGSYKLNVDLELLKKYNRPGPRYTSYPTAPQFSEDFGSSDFRAEIVDSNKVANAPNLSLYFHIPFCRSLCYFCACNTIITHSQERVEKYLADLKEEIDLLSGLISPGRKVVQLHWGGGTPTYLTPNQIKGLSLYIRDRFDIVDDAEIAMEIDPRGLDSRHLPTIREVGFNRVSFGVQDFDPRVQEAVNRVQPEGLSRDVVKTSRELGFESINIDLVYGLPYQTVESYTRTLDKIIDISPDRLAVFNWAYVPWLKKHQRVIPQEALPATGDRLRLLKLIIEKLTGAGYVYIGMDHFAKPDDELALALENRSLYRNFQGYSTRADAEVYGMGVTSISQLRNVYAQNTKDTKIYGDELSQNRIPTHIGYRLSDDDKLRRHVITELMCNGVVVKSDVGDQYGIDFDAYFADSIAKLDEFVGDGLLTISPDRIEVQGAGRLVIRNIAMVFDRYLDQSGDGSKSTYSRTV
ncbi:MAG: oxygen-independent coproporphyrinogen III oxidase [Candidatus Latescibacterota bacterium]|nr:MAG: oxygen-independent coproporphyrinogen III oxidase [Candidatus Latescibacterota bacterium]